MRVPEKAITPKNRFLTHGEACGIVNAAMRLRRDETVVIDMSEVDETTTSAFARLVLLRRQLRREGRDLRLSGMRDRTETLYEINRLDAVLPRI